MASIFQFKQFAVDQTDCAMKINTDGVLLASLIEGENPHRILDIGTGTGVIAMMLAQRFAKSRVEAVEIDSQAAKRADENFKNSIFNQRLVLHASSFQELDCVEPYDLIISNPPFYTDSLHNPDARKKLARHTDLSFFHELLTFSVKQLTSCGKLALILPTELAEEIKEMAKEFGLYLKSEIQIRSFVAETVIRKVIVLERDFLEDSIIDDFVIYESKGVYSQDYKQVLKPFFLAF